MRSFQLMFNVQENSLKVQKFTKLIAMLEKWLWQVQPECNQQQS